MQTSRVVLASVPALLLGALPLVVAHGDEHTMPGMASGAVNGSAEEELVPNYFRHPEYAGWMYAHIALMIVAWVAVLPPAIMLSVARSQYHLPAQVLFHVVNGLGVFVGLVYNHATPDLYEHNSHHPIGWIVTSLTIVWTLLSLSTAYAAHKRSHEKHPVTNQTLEQYNQLHQYVDNPTSARSSRDSGNFSGASRTNSSHSMFGKDELPLQYPSMDEHHGEEDYEGDSEEDARGFLGHARVERFMSQKLQRVFGVRSLAALRLSQIVLEKLLLLLGFLAITSGFVVYGGIFRKREIFSGLAHYVKGGIFFWYGLLTLGRWMGAFAEFGWAWNIRPESSKVARWKSRIPSAEFTESFIIWLYGASNVFMEHMNNWGKGWSASDLEHVSITLLFFGGGLLGMLIESKWIRNCMNTTVELQKSEDDSAGATEACEEDAASDGLVAWAQPKTYQFSLNPMPGLVIMLLGIMMSSHHQKSMVSTMMHAQWGTLFYCFALARAVTYIITYLKPPTSHFPSRPPSELVAAFCLTSGGLIFMNSAHDSVSAIEANGLGAMTIFTLVMGLTGVILAWEVVCFAIKGWAVRKERAARRS